MVGLWRGAALMGLRSLPLQLSLRGTQSGWAVQGPDSRCGAGLVAGI